MFEFKVPHSALSDPRVTEEMRWSVFTKQYLSLQAAIDDCVLSPEQDRLLRARFNTLIALTLGLDFKAMPAQFGRVVDYDLFASGEDDPAP